ncbi:MAG: hypothetical protein JW892_11815 [Anaerolineae bacterium]|nr:hypothetical protein [Anaerolineae bacterium]
MKPKKALVLILLCAMFSFACKYVVLPEGIDSTSGGSKGWTAVATGVESIDDKLRIHLTIRNETNDWSAMTAAPDKPALLSVDANTTNCATVFVSSGGHRLAPGFQMRGYIGGTKTEPVTQLLYVECEGATLADGATLTVDYIYFTGQFNYYEPEANKRDGRLEVDLSALATDLTYPIATAVEGLLQPPDATLTAINDVALTLAKIERTSEGFRFSWKTANPGEYPSYVHIGNPPVIGADGIIYGLYEIPDLASVPITPAGGEAEWATEVAAPQNVAAPQETNSLIMLLSVESGKQRLYANYAIDLSGY